MTVNSKFNRSLRRKLYSHDERLVSSKNPTKIIILKDDLSEASSLQQADDHLPVKASWQQKYDIKELNTLGLVTFYKTLLNEILIQVPAITTETVIEEIRKSLRKTFDASIASGKANALPRYLRKRILRRLSSLLCDFDPVHEIFSEVTVHRIILSAKSHVRIHSKNRQVSSSPLFFCEEEARLFIACLRKNIPNGTNSLLIKTARRDTQFLIETIHAGTRQESAVVLKRVASSGITLLDLIRRKVMSPNLARSISRVAREPSGGLIIYGATASGKSSFLTALLATLSAQRVPLLIDYSGEIHCSHPNLHVLSQIELEEYVRTGMLESAIDRIMSLGITDIFVDGISRLSFLFLSRAVARYPLQICATARGFNLPGIFSTLSNEYYLDIESFSEIFPLAISLEEDVEGSYVGQILEANKCANQVDFVTLVQCDREERSWHLVDSSSGRAAYFDSLVSPEC